MALFCYDLYMYIEGIEIERRLLLDAFNAWNHFILVV